VGVKNPIGAADPPFPESSQAGVSGRQLTMSKSEVCWRRLHNNAWHLSCFH